MPAGGEWTSLENTLERDGVGQQVKRKKTNVKQLEQSKHSSGASHQQELDVNMDHLN